MDNQTVNTYYVALQPPYKIIKHGNKIGVQIGTQRVVVAGGNPFRTETHDYPVVAAENRIAALKDNDYRLDGSSDGEIWDNVETKNVSVLCDAGVCLEWEQFIEILWHDHARLGNPRQQINKVYLFNKIVSYNKHMMLPPPDLYTLHLHTLISEEGFPYVVRTKKEDVFALNVEWSDNLIELENRLVSDLKSYLLILSPNRRTNFWQMHYETEEDRLRPLMERLNANPKATSFRNQIMASFTVKAIPPYEKKPTVREITWEERKQCFKTAVLIVMEKKKADGNYLFENNSQWMAVYRFAIDLGIMYKADDPRKPKDTSTPQYAAFAKFAKELQLDENPPTRLPFTKNAIDSINSKPNYARFNTSHPWSHEGITDPRSLVLFIELDNVYLALEEEYDNLISQIERGVG
jgi:hypothetical protein